MCLMQATEHSRTNPKKAKRGSRLCDLAPDGGDGLIDMADLAVLANQWRVGTE
jgi:hypothetical protein